MKKINLSSKVKAQLEQQHRATRDGKERDRLKAVLLYSEGWSSPQISQALRIHETSVNRHINDYGNDKLKPENGGSESALDENQTLELIEHLESHTYHYVHEIIEHIKLKYSVEYSVPGMNKWLHRHDFSYKKPKGHPYKADEKKQRNFIRKYKSLKNRLGSNEVILFMDAVHPTQETKLSHGWIRVGKTKKVETSAGRSRINLVGAINLNKPKNIQAFEYETVNADTIVHFLGYLREEHKGKGKIHLILDGAGYHRAPAVKQEAKKLNIKLHFLPPYSPNLNPIERLWKLMNEHARNNRFFKSSKDFREALYDFLKKTIPKIADSIPSRINDNFQIL